MPAISQWTRAINLRPNKVALNQHACDAAQINAVSVVARYDVARAGRCSSDRDASRTRIVNGHTIIGVAQIRSASNIGADEIALNLNAYP